MLQNEEWACLSSKKIYFKRVETSDKPFNELFANRDRNHLSNSATKESQTLEK